MAAKKAPSEACVNKLKVLAEPTRLAVLELLMAGAQNVSALQESLGIDQSLLSHHLRVLRDAGLVTATREGKTMRYDLAPDVGPRNDDSGDAPSALDLGCCRLSFE